MQLKTFTAKSTSEVLALIKAELGNEAVILETKEANGTVSITAALERAAVGKTPPGNGGMGNAVYGYGQNTPEAGWGTWQEEWGSIRSHLLSLMKPALRLEDLAPRQKLALEYLQREGVEDDAVLELFQTMRRDGELSILKPLGSMVPMRPWGQEEWPQKVHFIAGPYGAGKTSVTLRLALLLRKNTPGMRICVINADAARGNGRLFLRHYAELSDLTYKETASPIELNAALAAAAKESYDAVFVDLPGIGRETTLNSFLEEAGISPEKESYFCETWRDAAAVHLVLPPHYSTGHLRPLLARYKTLFRSSIVYTKLDEIDTFGQIVNVGYATGLPVSALSYGPGLGNSLTPVVEAMLWRLVFKRELPKRAA